MGILTEQVTTEDISILPDGTVKVRQKRVILDDGVVIFERESTTTLDKLADDDVRIADIEARLVAADAGVKAKKNKKPKGGPNA